MMRAFRFVLFLQSMGLAAPFQALLTLPTPIAPLVIAGGHPNQIFHSKHLPGVCGLAQPLMMSAGLLPDDLDGALRANGIDLNALQRTVLDAALRSLDVIVHAETGSGKTLCFALPMLARISAGAAGPQGIVLVPTLELAAQVARVFNTLRSGSAAALVQGAEELPEAPVLVGPPVMMLRLLSGGGASTAGGVLAPVTRLPRSVLGSLRTVVLDEADALLMPLGRYSTYKDRMRREEKPKEATALLEQLCATRGDELQILAASATVGRPLRRMLAATCEGRTFETVRVDGGGGGGTEEEDAEDGAAEEGAEDVSRVGGRAVGLPAGVSVSVVTSDEDNWLAAVHDVLGVEAAASPLLFIPPGRSLQAELQLLRQCSLDAVALDATVLESRAPLAAHSPAAMAAAAAPATDAAAGDAAETLRVLVATPSGARGLDIPGLDLVLIIGVPPTADALVHMVSVAFRARAIGSHLPRLRLPSLRPC